MSSSGCLPPNGDFNTEMTAWLEIKAKKKKKKKVLHKNGGSSLKHDFKFYKGFTNPERASLHVHIKDVLSDL